MAREYDPQLVEIGAKIVARREELGIKASKLAIYADISAVALSHIESGQSAIKIDTLIKIAVALKVSLSYFQPTTLNQYSEMPPELLSLIPVLKRKSPTEQKKLVQMFASMIDIM